MNYITKIFERCKLQRVTEFLLNGGGLAETDDHSHYERLEKAEQELQEGIAAYIPPEMFEPVMSLLLSYISVCKDVHTEIGLLAGASLALEASKCVNGER